MVTKRPVSLLAGTGEVESSRGFGYKPGLDGLRAVAVVSVMAYHFGATWAPGGFLGVDLFFVLSGYLITSLLVIEWDGTATIAFGAFWARRARRLLPALFLVLVAIAIWSALEASRDQLSSIRWDSIWTLFYGANWRFIATGQSYFDLFRDPSPLRHTWSLAIEEQFYLVWPIIAFGCLRLARGRRWLLAGACVAGIVGSTALMARWYDATDPSRSYYGTDTRAGQLLLGALLALILVRWTPRSVAQRAGVQAAGIVGAAFCVWAFASASDHQSWLYHGGFLVFAVAVAAVIVAVVQPRRSALQSLLTLRAVRWIGAISYGLYLWHWPVAVALTEGHTGLSGVRLAIVRIGVTLTAATLSYYLLELPIRRGQWLRGHVARTVAPVAGIATAVVIVVATSGGTAPPRFLVARPDTVVKTRPAATPAAPLQASEAQLGVARMLLLGDSVADTLGNELRRDRGRTRRDLGRLHTAGLRHDHRDPAARQRRRGSVGRGVRERHREVPERRHRGRDAGRGALAEHVGDLGQHRRGDHGPIRNPRRRRRAPHRARGGTRASRRALARASCSSPCRRRRKRARSTRSGPTRPTDGATWACSSGASRRGTPPRWG